MISIAPLQDSILMVYCFECMLFAKVGIKSYNGETIDGFLTFYVDPYLRINST